MSIIKWDESYSLNIQSIDDQHKKLIELINEFYETVTTNKDYALSILLSGLTEYVLNHFQLEENYFKQFAYPKAEEHIKEHKVFIEKLNSFKPKYAGEKPTISVDLVMFLRNWLIHHIQGTDKQYIECFVKNGVK